MPNNKPRLTCSANSIYNKDLKQAMSKQSDPTSIPKSEHSNDALISAFFNAPAELPTNFRSGLAAIVGRPNVGKSTLMNHLLGQKISITSRKPQTTRHKILGIDNQADAQIVYVDTPGMHLKEVKAMNKMLNKTATSALKDIDVVVFVIDALKWTEDDQMVADKLANLHCPLILAINKVDRVEDKTKLLPHIEHINSKLNFAHVLPISALTDFNLEPLRQVIAGELPLAQPLYGREQVTDRTQRFMASEIIREKIMRQLGDELPYDISVQIETFKEEPAHTDPKTGKPRKACTFIDATILVERAGQKAIVVGDKGSRIKTIGSEARKDMEASFEQKIMLTLWVKVKQGWSDDERALKSLGYGDI